MRDGEGELIEMGTEVALASGGPVMTVTNLGEEDVGCTWWEPHYEAPTKCGRYQTYRFPPVALIVVDEDEDDGEELAS